MKQTIKFGLIVTSSLFLTAYSNADIIELDMQNGDKCRQQITTAKDQYPIILDYSPSCGACQRYMPIYDQVASKYPQRAFFKAREWEATEEVKVKCLQETGSSAVPRPRAVWQFVDASGKQRLLNAIAMHRT
jgi:thiol-disulfide isomerase/thioredoxin